MSAAERIAGVVTGHSRLVLLAFVIATVLIGAGAAGMEQSTSVAVADEPDIAEDTDYVQQEFGQLDPNETVMMVSVRNEDESVLTRESILRSLEYQQTILSNESIAPMLSWDEFIGVSNVVASTAVVEAREGQGGSEPTLDEQIAQIESMDDDEVAAVVERSLAGDGVAGEEVFQLLPEDYEPGSTTAHARLMAITFETDGPVRTGAAVSQEITDAQVDSRELAEDNSGPDTYLVVGNGLVGQQEDQAIQDSFGIVGPVALLFVITALTIAYRDPVDVVLGLAGVAFVLVWTFGIMGWIGIPFNQVMIAVPILLIGLSVDYAFHTIMRYREEQAAGDGDVRGPMKKALTGVGPALALVTVTTAIGFLANYTSPLTDLREFGIATAVGIVATFLVFGSFVPALKVELDSALQSRGWDRSARAFGTTGRLKKLLGVGSTVARRAPVVVLVLALLASAGGAYGATQLDTSFSPGDFLADEPPEVTESLPEGMQPGEHYLKTDRAYIYDEFQTLNQQASVLVTGSTTDPAVLQRIDAAEQDAIASDVTIDRPDGDPAVGSPVSGMRTAASNDESFNQTLASADTDGDGVPDRNVEAVFDAFYAAAPDVAEQYVERTEDGEYGALRLRMALDGTADDSRVDDTVSELAVMVETGDGTSTANADTSVTASEAGLPLVETAIAEQLANSVIESLVVTLGAILAILTATFYVTKRRALLGLVTLLPVVFAVSWLLGTMSVLDVPISVTTALVASIAVGLGVDYTIHVTERFGDELDGLEPGAALDRTVTGTGGALLSSAITTIAGFGVLAFTLLPALQQFGLALAFGILYSFLAAVLVQPSLLALWARYGAGSDVAAGTTATVGSD